MEICSFELAKKLKDKGYPQKFRGEYECFGPCYFIDGSFCERGALAEIDELFTATTYYEVFEWLREEKSIYVNLRLSKEYEEDGNWNVCNEWVYWTYNIQRVSTGEIIFDYDDEFDAIQFQTYELAAHDAIEYILNNLI